METIIKNINKYQLDEFASLSKVVQFDQCIKFLERAGKATFGKHFAIRHSDYKIIFLLLVYFYYDLENAERFDIDLKKGILLSGPVGCGKTCLMYLPGIFALSLSGMVTR